MPPQSTPYQQALHQVLEARLTLTREDARDLLAHALDYPDDLKLAAIFGALASRGETPEELAGFVDTLRARAVPIPLTDPERASLVDTCGTGGDHSNTFNISTAAALVAAAAGAAAGADIMVAKHGNRAVTSTCGSADVLEALGIPVDHTPESAAEALRRHRFAFLAAPIFQPAMGAVLPLRRALGVRTAFNLLGPLINPTNPSGALSQVIGVFNTQSVSVVAETLSLLGTHSAFVVHGSGMDEFTIGGPTLVAQIIDGEVQIGTVNPEDFGLPLADPASLAGGNARENAQTLRDIFAGQPGPRRDVVVMNAAAVLITANLAEDFRSGAALAQHTIDSGAVKALLSSLRS